MSKERIVIGAVLCFLSGIVLTQPPEFWQEVFSLPSLVARWVDAGVLACAGVWLGVTWSGRQEAALAEKLTVVDNQTKLLTQQVTGINNGMLQFQAAINAHETQLRAMQSVKP